jgi:hypothetical protein
MCVRALVCLDACFISVTNDWISTKSCKLPSSWSNINPALHETQVKVFRFSQKLFSIKKSQRVELYDFYLEHFSTWRILYKMQGK